MAAHEIEFLAHLEKAGLLFSCKLKRGKYFVMKEI